MGTILLVLPLTTLSLGRLEPHLVSVDAASDARVLLAGSGTANHGQHQQHRACNGSWKARACIAAERHADVESAPRRCLLHSSKQPNINTLAYNWAHIVHTLCTAYEVDAPLLLVPDFRSIRAAAIGTAARLHLGHQPPMTSNIAPHHHDRGEATLTLLRWQEHGAVQRGRSSCGGGCGG